MREQGVNWLPVVADSQLVGVLGRSDLLSVFLRSDAAIRTEIVEDVLVGALATDPSRVAVDVVDGVVTLTLVHRPADGDERVVERPIADHADGSGCCSPSWGTLPQVQVPDVVAEHILDWLRSWGSVS